MAAHIPKKRIMFFCEEVTLAHVTRPLLLAKTLNEKNYEIIFACGKNSKYLFQKENFHYLELPSITPEIFLERLKKGTPLYKKKELIDYCNFEKQLISDYSPDLIVGDFRISLGITSELLSIPYICITNAHWSPYSTQPFPAPEHFLVKILGDKYAGSFFDLFSPLIFKYHSLDFNAARKHYGLSPVHDMKNVYTFGNYAFYPDIPQIAPTHDIPSNHKYIGPVIWSPSIPLPEWWNDLPSNKPLAYITMGSSGEIRALHMVIETIKKMGWVGVIATAGRINIENDDDIFVEKYLPGVDVLKKASLAICNGGSATAYQSLSLGVPILGLPSNADQFFTINAVQSNGAGLLIRPSTASFGKIFDAIADLGKNEAYANAACKISATMKEFNCSELFPKYISEII